MRFNIPFFSKSSLLTLMLLILTAIAPSHSVHATQPSTIEEVDVLVKDIQTLRLSVKEEEDRGIDHSPMQVEWAEKSDLLRRTIQRDLRLLAGQKLEDLATCFPFIAATPEGRKLLREYRIGEESLICYYLRMLRSIVDDPAQKFDPNRILKCRFGVRLQEMIHVYLLDNLFPSPEELNITTADLNPCFRSLLFFPARAPDQLSSFLIQYRNREGQNFAQILAGNENALAELKKATRIKCDVSH